MRCIQNVMSSISCEGNGRNAIYYCFILITKYWFIIEYTLALPYNRGRLSICFCYAKCQSYELNARIYLLPHHSSRNRYIYQYVYRPFYLIELNLKKQKKVEAMFRKQGIKTLLSFN